MENRKTLRISYGRVIVPGTAMLLALSQLALAQNYIKTPDGKKFELSPEDRSFKVRNEPYLSFVLRTQEQENGITVSWHDFSAQPRPDPSSGFSDVRLLPTKMGTIKVRFLKFDGKKKEAVNSYTARFLEINGNTHEMMFDAPGARLEFVGDKDVPFIGWMYKPGGAVEINEDGDAVPTQGTLRYKK